MKKIITLLLLVVAFVGQAEATSTYQVAGEESLLGSSWTAIDMTDEDGDGIYTYTTTRTISSAGNKQFKFIKSNDWDTLNKSNREINFQEAGTYKIVFTVNSSNDECNAYAILKPSSVTFVGKGITSDDWASTETGFTANGDSWTFTIDQTKNNNVYFRFKIGSTEYCPNTASNRWFNSTDGWTMNMNTWSTYQGTNGCFCLSSFNYLYYSRYIVRVTPYADNIYLEVFAYEKASTNSSGYCTFVNNYPLTISSATAYYATDDGDGSATAHAITNPPASTPMLIKGTASTDYYFAVAASGTDLDDTNAFKPGDGSTVASGTGPYNYILNGDAFFLANGKTVAAGKAYLQLTKAASARPLNFPDEEGTGIKLITTSDKNTGATYNLKGQRVANPSKGLYIVNGRKVIMK